MKQPAIPFVAALMDGHGAASPGQASLVRRRLLHACRVGLNYLFDRRDRPQSDAPRVDELAELDRVAIHESGHCLAARLLGRPVHSASVIPDAKLGFAGCVMVGDGPPAYRTIEEGIAEVEQISRIIDRHMPRPGESRQDIEPWLRSVHENAVELLAGAAAETVAFGRANDGTARSDYLKAQRLARTICASDASAEAFLEFAGTEAVEVIRPYRSVLLALADELANKRELDGAAIDEIITAALVQADRDRDLSRRAAWYDLTQRASVFEKDQGQ